MHPMIPQLAKRFGVQLSDRIAIDTNHGLPSFFQYSDALFNGKDLATRIQLWKCLFDDDYNLEAEIKTEVVEQLDHIILHDIAHYVVAKDEQKDLPEFGLGSPIYAERLGETVERLFDCVPSVIESAESDIQEYMAQLLCFIWGKEYGIDPKLSDWQGTWNEYLSMKFEHASSSEGMWMAMLRLEEMGFWKHAQG